MDKLLDREFLNRRRQELAAINSEILKMEDPGQLEKLFQSITGFVPEADEIEFADIKKVPQVAKQIATITGAAPKTFNINIENLIETMEINTTNLQESTVEIKQAVTRAMGEALADVEPITQ